MRLPGALTELLDFLLPAGCIACGDWIPAHPGTGLLCGLCRSRLKGGSWPRCPRCHLPLGTGRFPSAACRACSDWPGALTAARWAYALEHPADVLVHALKYEGWRELGDEMGAAMARISLPPKELKPEPLVVPVPTTRERLRERGYNQAAVLAESVARHRGWTVTNALKRTRSGETQVALHPSERRANVKGAFAPRRHPERSVEGAHVILVDDVLTTGSTAAAAAFALAGMGASAVTLLTFARALPDRLRKAA